MFLAVRQWCLYMARGKKEVEGLCYPSHRQGIQRHREDGGGGGGCG